MTRIEYLYRVTELEVLHGLVFVLEWVVYLCESMLKNPAYAVAFDLLIDVALVAAATRRRTGSRGKPEQV